MTGSQFDKLLARRLESTEIVLGTKAGEYASKADRLHNFKAAAKITRTTQAKALLGMLAKHLVSVVDLVESHSEEPGATCMATVDEKIGDAINYLILLEAVFKEHQPDSESGS